MGSPQSDGRGHAAEPHGRQPLPWVCCCTTHSHTHSHSHGGCIWGTGLTPGPEEGWHSKGDGSQATGQGRPGTPLAPDLSFSEHLLYQALERRWEGVEPAPPPTDR